MALLNTIKSKIHKILSILFGNICETDSQFIDIYMNRKAEFSKYCLLNAIHK